MTSRMFRRRLSSRKAFAARRRLGARRLARWRCSRWSTTLEWWGSAHRSRARDRGRSCRPASECPRTPDRYRYPAARSPAPLAHWRHCAPGSRVGGNSRRPPRPRRHCPRPAARCPPARPAPPLAIAARAFAASRGCAAIDRDHGAASFRAGDGCGATRLLGEAIDLAQAEPGALADLFVVKNGSNTRVSTSGAMP